jgi:hypothetical protein
MLSPTGRRCEPKSRRVFGVHLYAQRIRRGIEEEWLLLAATLRDLARWSVKPAKNVDTAKTPRVNVLRGLAARATTPLLPDDYLKLLNPLWSARELRGEVVDVRTETQDSATVTIEPGWGFSAEYQPTQYVGIGLRIDGRWYWRSYSLTSVPRRDDKRITITVKATPEGFLATHLVNGVKPGTIVRLAAPKGDFACRTRRRRRCCSSVRALASPRSWRCCVRSRPAVRPPLLDCRTAYVDAPTCLRFTNNQTAIPIARTDSKSTASTTMAPPRLMLSLPQLGSSLSRHATRRHHPAPRKSRLKRSSTVRCHHLLKTFGSAWAAGPVARIAATGYKTLDTSSFGPIAPKVAVSGSHQLPEMPAPVSHQLPRMPAPVSH